MLSDIFAARYETIPLFKVFSRRERRVLHQCFTILEELHPYWMEEKEKRNKSQSYWKTLHKRVANELGQRWLSDPYYQTEVGLGEYRRTESRQLPEIEICRRWNQATPDAASEIDEFIKERLSLVEIGLREVYHELERSERLTSASRQLGTLKKEFHDKRLIQYNNAFTELNIRFSNARLPLHYHNGFIQMLGDDKINAEIEQPFWSAVSEEIWENVDLDMKEAIDQRDTGAKDPALYAAKALESSLKIISSKLGATHGGEKGAHGFIDNIAKKDVKFIEQWEAELIKSFFTKVRNPLGHGPGNGKMPKLTYEQNSWAIECAMSWIKLLVHRYQTLANAVAN